MKFKIEKKEYVNKTFRLEKELVDELYEICDKQDISLTKLVVQCIRFALDNLDDNDNKE